MYKNRDEKERKKEKEENLNEEKREDDLEKEDFLSEEPIEDEDKEEAYNDPEIRRTVNPAEAEESGDRNTQKKIISDKYDKRKYHRLVSPRERA